MEKKHWKSILLIELLLFTVIACSISLDNGGDEKLGQKNFETQLTIEALQRTQTALASTPENSQQQPQDSQQDQDSNSDSNSDDDSDNETPCNSSKFVSETIPDGTVYQAGDTFTKSWTLRNAGGCDWTTDYTFVFEEGNQMKGLTSMKVPSVIEPGETITFNVDLTAPNSDGDYTGVWRLKAADGEKLGKYWAKITVGSSSPPPAAFAISSVMLTTATTNVVAPACPIDVNVQAAITSSAAGTATYHWRISGMWYESDTFSVTFAGAETKTVNWDFPVEFSDTINVDLYVDDPNHQWFGPITIDVDCP